MPEPVPYDPAKCQAQLNATSNPAEWARIIGDAREQADRQHAAHREAIQVVETYSASLRNTNAAMPAFTPPPRFGDGATGRTPGGPMPDGRAGGVVPPVGGAPVGGAGGSAPRGAPAVGGGGPPTAVGNQVAVGNQLAGHGSGGAPPSSTPEQSVSHAPGIPGGGVPAGGSGGQPGGPSFLPAAAAAVIGGAGSSGRGSSAGVRFGPRGSSGLGTSSLGPNPASNSLGRGGVGSVGAAGASRGTAGMASHAAGAGSGFAPMAGTGRGQGEDTEHRRPSYLIETEDIWGDGRRVAPPVIGEDPPEYHY
jgi:hypothetical protein